MQHPEQKYNVEQRSELERKWLSAKSILSSLLYSKTLKTCKICIDGNHLWLTFSNRFR